MKKLKTKKKLYNFEDISITGLVLLGIKINVKLY